MATTRTRGHELIAPQFEDPFHHDDYALRAGADDGERLDVGERDFRKARWPLISAATLCAATLP